MFGSKKNKKSEKGKSKFSIFGEKQEVLEANVSHIERRENQILEDLAQVGEHTAVIVETATLNTGTEVILLQTLGELAEEQRKAYADYTLLCDTVREQIAAGIELVEKNKHFTTPSRYLSEAPGALREKNKRYEQYLREMDDSNYEEKAEALRNEITESYKDIQELEKVVHHLVALLKESNIATTKLLKKFQSNEKIIRDSSMRDFSQDYGELMEDLMGVRSLEEEIVKCGERANLQVSDVREEMQAIKNEIAEIESDISYLMEVAGKQER